MLLAIKHYIAYTGTNVQEIFFNLHEHLNHFTNFQNQRAQTIEIVIK